MSVRASRWLRATRVGFLVVAATTGAAALAEEQTAASEEMRADIEHLIKLTGAMDDKVIDQMGSVMAQQMAQLTGATTPEAAARCVEIAIEAVGEILSDGKFMDDIVAIYAKYYSHDDIRQMIAFYDTPAGKKTIEVMPQLMAESVQVSMKWMAQMNPVIQERVTKQLREEDLIE